MEFTVNISTVEAIFLLAAVGLVVRLIVWYANVNSDRKSFKEFIVKVEKKIDDIADRLDRLGRGSLIESASPLRLTKLGKEVSSEINAVAIASAMATKLKEQIQGKSSYEIQQLCFDWVAEDKLSDEHKQLVQDIAFARGLTIPQVMEVIAIELRERLLAQEQRDSSP